MLPKCVVFDVGGVILDWRPCLENVSTYLNVSLDQLIPVFNNYLPDLEIGAITPSKAWKCIIEQLKLSADADRTIEVWMDSYHEILPTNQLIIKLKSRFKLALCTNTWLGVTQIVLPRYSVFSNFPVIVDSSVEKVRKPNHDIYKIVETCTGYIGQEIFFVDDSLENINSAAQFGWQTFQFNSASDYGASSVNDLSKLLINK